MFSLTIKQAQRNFFDRAHVQKRMDEATGKALSKAGAFVMRTARRSIKDPPRKRIKDLDPDERRALQRRRRQARAEGRPLPKPPMITAVSAPGSPPFNHLGLLRDFIYFSHDTQNESVIIGPARLQRVGDAPHALEFGGMSARWSWGSDGKVRKRPVRIRARPYMAPALEKNLPKISPLLRNSLGG